MGQPDNEWIPVERVRHRLKHDDVWFVWFGGRPYICRWYSVTPAWFGPLMEGWEVVDDHHSAGPTCLTPDEVSHVAPIMLGPNDEEAAF